MHISILTLFPQMFLGPFEYSIVKRAQATGVVDIRLINIRDFSTDSHKTVDDHPYGGGAGMILRVDVIDRALQSVKRQKKDVKEKIVLLDPQGTPYAQSKARELSVTNHVILICGHYEGIDERVRSLVDETISIGDFVLTGGEIPAMAITDSIVRLLPGVLQKDTATVDESFTHDLLEYPQYTRPQQYLDMKVPAILLSGDHKAIADWRNRQQIANTEDRRPDLKKKIPLQSKRVAGTR
ncbi:tRNA (guanosine(37)-N1)-methyltransferase TrmD [Candidatus Gottesmanbacteria bacterium]|nr:tRNA (guanosine(37)-N1)-methyltransferase TrmD [Candidatus Gottesmanbacteria bacterium]